MKKGKRPIVLWIMLGLCGVVVLAGGAGVLLFNNLFLGEARAVAATLPKQMQRAEELELPLHPSDLKRNPPVPKSQNAAADYRKAVTILEADPDASKNATTLGTFSTKGGSAEVAADLLKKQAGWLKHIKAATSKRQLDFEYDYALGPDVMFPEFAPLKNAEKMLCGKAAYELRSGNTSAAIETLRQASVIPGHLAQEPALISHLVSIANETIWHATARQLLSERSSDRRFVNGMKGVVSKMYPYPDLRWALRGEVVIGWVVLENLDQSIEKIPQWSAGTGDPAPEPSGFNPLRFAKGNKIWKEAFMARNLEAWNEIFSWFPETGDADVVEITKRMDQLVEKQSTSKGLTYTLNAILFPVFSQAGGAYTKIRSERELTRAVIALYQYKHSHGRFPNSLSDAGNFVDAFTKKSLLYRQVGAAGFMVYSVGTNGVDDGGDSSKGEDSRARDIVVTGS